MWTGLKRTTKKDKSQHNTLKQVQKSCSSNSGWKIVPEWRSSRTRKSALSIGLLMDHRLYLGTTNSSLLTERSILLGIYLIKMYVRYLGQNSWYALKVKIKILNSILDLNGNQCSSFKIGEMWLHFFELVSIWAMAFWTYWSFWERSRRRPDRELL